MTPKATSISAIVLSLGLIGFSVYTINNFSKDPTNSTVSKIVVDLFGVLFILGAIGSIWMVSKTLSN